MQVFTAEPASTVNPPVNRFRPLATEVRVRKGNASLSAWFGRLSHVEK